MFAHIVFAITLATSSAVQISINPSTYTDDSAGPVTMFCFSDASGSVHIDVISSMEIRKDDERPLVSLNATAGVSTNPDVFDSAVMQVEGNIDRDVSQTYLRLTLTNPKLDDQGVYTCSLQFRDKVSAVHTLKASKEFKVEKFDVKEVTRSLLDKVKSLQSTVKQQADINSKLQTRLDAVETATKNQSKKISDLDEKGAATHNRLEVVEDTSRNQTQIISDLKGKGTYMEAFSVGLNSDIKLNVDDVIVYPSVKWSQGQDYNSSTGIFTAPRSGLYGFDLSVMNKCRGCWVDICIKANDRQLTCVRAASEEGGWWAQGSGSAADVLDKGDSVYVYVFGTNDNGGKLFGGWRSYNQFTGYLIRAL